MATSKIMSKLRVRGPAMAWVAGAMLLPRLAAACPMCAGQQSGGVARVVALGSMILFPFSIAFIVFRVLRRATGSPPESSSRATPEVDRERAEGVRELSL